jgi:hypothetical protein
MAVDLHVVVEVVRHDEEDVRWPPGRLSGLGRSDHRQRRRQSQERRALGHRLFSCVTGRDVTTGTAVLNEDKTGPPHVAEYSVLLMHPPGRAVLFDCRDGGLSVRGRLRRLRVHTGRRGERRHTARKPVAVHEPEEP